MVTVYLNRNLGFPIQNLSSDSRLEVRFRHFGCFWVSTLPVATDRQLGFVSGSLGIFTGLCIIWLKFCMIAHRKIPAGRHVAKMEPEVEF